MQAATHVSPVVQADPGPLARLAAVQSDPIAPTAIFQRVADGETLHEIAQSWKVPKGRFVEWYTTEHAERYEAALRVVTEDIAHKVKRILDDVTPETVSVVKTQVHGYLQLAAKWNRQRYGESMRLDVGGEVTLKADFSRPAPIEAEDAVLVGESSASEDAI